MTLTNDLWWRLRYTFWGRKFFGWRTAWYFSLAWCNGELDRDGYSPWDAVCEDLSNAL